MENCEVNACIGNNVVGKIDDLTYTIKEGVDPKKYMGRQKQIYGMKEIEGYIVFNDFSMDKNAEFNVELIRLRAPRTRRFFIGLKLVLDDPTKDVELGTVYKFTGKDVTEWEEMS